jgi:hypothetical protein
MHKVLGFNPSLKGAKKEFYVKGNSPQADLTNNLKVKQASTVNPNETKQQSLQGEFRPHPKL